MGGLQKVPIVAINGKGEVVGYYESISEASQANGIGRRLITEALRTGRLCSKVKWIRESEYRQLWFEGRTAELSFSSKQIRSEIAVRRWKNLTDEQRKSRSLNLSKARKKLIQERPDVMEPSRESHRRPVLCVNTGECFRSIVELSNAYGLNPASVRACALRGIRNKGYIIKHITKEEYDQRKNQGNDTSHPSRPQVD